jgi:hypothetical protein
MGYGKASSSWISPRNSDLANDETPSTGGVAWRVVAASIADLLDREA